MRIPFVAGNWKMHTTAEEVRELLNSLKVLLKDVENVTVAVCPPFPYLILASEILDGSSIHVGAQNMHWESEGAYTGEVSPRMLKDVGCEFVIIGHSERRKLFGETDEIVHRKIQAALRQELHPIVCVGETLEEREEGKTTQIVESQIRGAFTGFTVEEFKKITIAYEPIWAIGTGRTATPEQAEEVHRLIRVWIADRFGREVAEEVRIQYGGSVKPENAAALLAQDNIDGALVGGASLKAESFAAIVKEAGS